MATRLAPPLRRPRIESLDRFPGTPGSPNLSERDIRERLDEAVFRGWGEIGRRIARIGTLVVVDSIATLAALAVLGSFLLPSAAEEASVFGWPLGFAAGVVGILELALAACGSLRSGRERTSRVRQLAGVLLGIGLMGGYSKLLENPLPIPLLFALFLCVFPSIVLGRWTVSTLVSHARRQGWLTKRLMILGSLSDVERFSKLLPWGEGRDVQIVGRIPLELASQLSTEGGRSALNELIRQHGAAGILVAANLDIEGLDRLMARCFEIGISLSVVPQAFYKTAGELELRCTQSGMMIELRPMGLRLPQLAIKRLVDLVFATAALILIWPLLVAIAVAIKLDSPGPALFRQARAGVGGRPFSMLKFRTMVTDADDRKKDLGHLNASGDPRLFKIRNDPRITKLGRWLRKSSLDELPQLFNVLRGEMSLVGPRPFFPGDLVHYEDHHFERLFVLPGITGLWQISGRSEVTDFEEVVRLDREYIRNWTLARDFGILVRTLPGAIGRGAY